MKNHLSNRRYFSRQARMVVFLGFSFLITSCGIVQLSQPTATVLPTAVLTATPVITASPLPTDTPEPTLTASPTPLPPTATPLPSPTPTPTGQYSTEFDDVAEIEQWQAFRVDTETFRLVDGLTNRVTGQMSDGKFVLDIREELAWVYYIFQPLDAADVKLETEANNRGRNNNNVSLICRYSEEGWYEFNIANNGLWWIFRYDPAIRDYVELASGGATSINMGQSSNRYSAICKGNELSLYINGGTPIKTVTDRKLSQGKIGLSVSSFRVLPIVLEFEWLRVSVP